MFRLLARIDPARLLAGDRLRLSVQAERLHFFDPKNPGEEARV
jgi:hypothetical protein